MGESGGGRVSNGAEGGEGKSMPAGDTGDSVAFHVGGGGTGDEEDGGFLGGGGENDVTAGQGKPGGRRPGDEAGGGGVAIGPVDDVSWVDEGAGRQGRVEAAGQAEAEEGGGSLGNEGIGSFACAFGGAAADRGGPVQGRGQGGFGFHADEDCEGHVCGDSAGRGGWRDVCLQCSRDLRIV